MRCAFLFFIVVSLVSCSKTGVECAHKTKPYKVKKYRVKRKKRKTMVYGGGGAKKSNQSSAAQRPIVEPAPKIDSLEQVVSKTESPIKTPVAKPKPIAENKRQATIPELKTGEPPKEEEIVEFRGEKIAVSEDSGFTFEENIVFIDQSDLFINREEAYRQISDLAKLLKQHKNLKVTIVGNAATDAPMVGILYGDGEDVLNQTTSFNADDATIRDVMLARANRVKELLQEQGASANQLNIITGTYRKYAGERVVSFIIRTKE